MVFEWQASNMKIQPTRDGGIVGVIERGYIYISNV